MASSSDQMIADADQMASDAYQVSSDIESVRAPEGRLVWGDERFRRLPSVLRNR
jgi:hypothetical protein